PDGVLVEVQRNGRAYHLRLPVSVRAVTERVDILIGRNREAPELASDVLSVRTLPGRQPAYLFVRNESTRPRKFAVQLNGPGLPVAQATITLSPNETAPVPFNPVPIPVPPSTPGTAPPATDLPELAGPIEVRVLDLEDRNQVVATKTIRIDIASP